MPERVATVLHPDGFAGLINEVSEDKQALQCSQCSLGTPVYVQQLLICLQRLSVSKPLLVEVALASKQADSRLQSIAVVKAAGAERSCSPAVPVITTQLGPSRLKIRSQMQVLSLAMQIVNCFAHAQADGAISTDSTQR